VDPYAISWDARYVVEKTDDLLPEERKFAEEVTRLRKERGWTQARMAELLVEQGVTYMTQSTVSRVEKLQRPVRVGEAEAWALVLDRTVWRLMHPSPIDELIEALRSSTNVLRYAWEDMQASMRAYARARGDLDGTITDLRSDAGELPAESGRRWELETIAQSLETYRDLEQKVPDLFLQYIREESADGKHPTAS
jgi:transcriptional regulator with XRE-family HTH domain